MENMYLNEYEAEVGQNSKGLWYCKSLKVRCYCLRDGISLIDTGMSDITKLLSKYNIKNSKD